MIFALSTIPEIVWKAFLTSELLQKFCLFNDLRTAHLELLELDSDFFSSLNVFSKEDLSEGPRADHSAHLEAIVDADLVRVIIVLLAALRWTGRVRALSVVAIILIGHVCLYCDNLF